MTSVVTGAAGFIGQALVRALIAAGDRVIGIDRDPQPSLDGLTAYTADLLDGDPAARAALAGADRVFHLAGCPGVRDERPGIEARRYRDNVLATAAVLADVPVATPLVLTSSSSVYGGTSTSRPSAETDRLRPRGGYARSKIDAERLCAARIDAGAPTVVARPFTVAGEGQRPDMALSLWISLARAGEPLRVLGSAQRTRDLTDVHQAALALVALSDGQAGGVVNLGTGTGHSIAQMVAAVAAALDTDVRTYVEPARDVEPSDTLADTRALRARIGWVPETDLTALVARQAASLPLGVGA